MIKPMPGLAIPEDEINFTASRSGGPGGQNVNKVSSKVTLTFNIPLSTALSDEQKRRIMTKLSTRINKQGMLQIVSQRTRSQELNRADALSRFCDLVRRALTPQLVRIKTHVPVAVKAERIDKKRQRGAVKRGRSDKGLDS